MNRGTGVEMDWEPLPGGWSGESFLAAMGDERQVVRIYSPQRGHRERAAEVDAALFRLWRGLVPVPEVLEVRPGSEEVPQLLVTRYVEGVRADVVVRELVEAGESSALAELGEALGHVAAVLAGMPTTGPGVFTGPDLVPVVRRPEDHDLVALVESRPGRLQEWEPQLFEGLLEVAVQAQAELEADPGPLGRTCVVHGDFVPQNVIVAPTGHRVLAVVDPEHAHSGSPYRDLGSLVRFDRHPGWEEAVSGAWGAHRQVDPKRALHLARGADLLALVNLASRPGGNLVVDLADLFLREVAVTGDRHAHP